MAVTTTTIDHLFVGEQPPVRTAAVTVADGQTCARGAAMGKALYGAVTSSAVTGTGNGTVTSLATVVGAVKPIVGDYVLTCTAAGAGGVAAGSVTDGSNTGNGTVTALAISALQTPKVGTFTLTCTDANTGGTGSATATATATGNGTASAVTVGTEAVEGDYIVTCTDASVSGSEIFQVVDPNGVLLEDLTVGVAYLNNHFGVTISDGDTDFIVGDYWTIAVTIAHGGKFKLADPGGDTVISDLTLPGTTGGTLDVDSGGITFTITDGSTDFAVDDSFTMTVTATELGGGTFKLVDPNGGLVGTDLVMTGGAGVSTAFEVAGLAFTITDGSTDFAAADYFTITVAAGTGYVSKLDKTAVDGTAQIYGILYEAVTTDGAEATSMVYLEGKFNSGAVTFVSGTAYTDVEADARTKGIYFGAASY